MTNIWRALLCLMLIHVGGAHARCVVSVPNIVIGNYDPSNFAPTMGAADIVIDCRSPILVTVNISASQVSGSVDSREMRHTTRTDRLAYNIFSDAAMTVVWGDGTQQGGNVTKVDGLIVKRAYAQIKPRQDVWLGDYQDTIMVTILP